MPDETTERKLRGRGEMEDSLAKRFVSKIGSSILSLPLNFFQQWLVTRALGPSEYGSISLLMGIFVELFVILDSGTSIGFYVKLCARTYEIKLVTFYWRFANLLGILSIVLVSIIISSGLIGRILPGYATMSVLLALLSAYGLWLTGIAVRVFDANGQTVVGEKWRIAVRAISLLALLTQNYISKLTVNSFLLNQVGFSVILILVLQRVLRFYGLSLHPKCRLSSIEVKQYLVEFWKYSSPVFVFGLISSISLMIERWLLDLFGGKVEQGFYGLAVQISTICFLVANAMIPLLSREIARDFADKNFTRISFELTTQIPRLYFISGLFGAFMVFEADLITQIVGGDQYKNAELATALMCLYPIHQTIGQINGSYFYSTGQTRLHQKIGIFNLSWGLVFTALFLGPKEWGGFSLGSVGLSFKTVFVQMVAVNIQLYYIGRQLMFSVKALILKQVLVLGFLLIFSFCSKNISCELSSVKIIQVLLNVFIFFGLSTILVLIWPGCVSLSRSVVSLEGIRTLARQFTIFGKI